MANYFKHACAQLIFFGSALALALSSLALNGCSADVPSTTQPSEAIAATSPVDHSNTQEPPCPSQDFETFAIAFADDVKLQRTFVIDPIESITVDTSAEPEPALVKKFLHRNELPTPLIPDTAEQTHSGLTLTVMTTGPHDAFIKLAKKDTDYQTSLFFKKEKCWVLHRIEDDSL